MHYSLKLLVPDHDKKQVNILQNERHSTDEPINLDSDAIQDKPEANKTTWNEIIYL